MQEIKHLQSHKKIKFTPEEDSKLSDLVQQYGENDWSTIASFMDGRNKRQCRERWRHYLSPQVSTEPFTEEEDKLLHYKYLEYGHKWKLIATFFPNRTDITVKNRWLFLHRQFERNMKGQNNQSELSITQNSSFNNYNQVNNMKFGMNYNLMYSSFCNSSPLINSTINQYSQMYSSSPMQSPTSPAPAISPISSEHESVESIDNWADCISNFQWDDFNGNILSTNNRNSMIIFS